jgi:hypothetical protein
MTLSDKTKLSLEPSSLLEDTHLARLAFPHKVSLASAAAHLIGFLLQIRQQNSSVSSRYYHLTYKSTNAHRIGMYLAARCALYFEGVPERALSRIGWLKLAHSAKRISTPYTCE